MTTIQQASADKKRLRAEELEIRKTITRAIPDRPDRFQVLMLLAIALVIAIDLAHASKMLWMTLGLSPAAHPMTVVSLIGAAVAITALAAAAVAAILHAKGKEEAKATKGMKASWWIARIATVAAAPWSDIKDAALRALETEGGMAASVIAQGHPDQVKFVHQVFADPRWHQSLSVGIVDAVAVVLPFCIGLIVLTSPFCAPRSEIAGISAEHLRKFNRELSWLRTFGAIFLLIAVPNVFFAT